ncbi:family 2 glycosyl transferase [Nibricoccus aquaticus]|uniref:Family 2 glycosyl transferase n=1 Tax=Nibricoccus aquaticus TaxID=2576891 RepID=A0A290QC37_9BACT|nr:glycosyltransferase family 2 protein [Nibricoccus aquaticus]ATC66229.1 family 2 glycosyl transferase [Nibricoccus aquaticus]
MDITVIICAHNPARPRLQRTLEGLRLQSLPSDRWQTLLIDNASSPALTPDEFVSHAPPNLRLLHEPTLGLTAARRVGLRAATTEFVILVDDDNVLAPDYLAETLAAFARLPRVGALGGKSLPEFTKTIQHNDWRREFFPLLALRDLGPAEKISTGLRPPGATRNQYPDFAPIGAGMALRRSAITAWLENTSSLTDRRGTELTSAGDNDLIFSVLRSGWEVAYVPALSLTHLIPPSRLTPRYLARLNHGIQKSWTQLLLLHDASPWPPIAPWTLHLRRLKAWFTLGAWRSPAALIRWSGTCGHFEGRAYPPRAR